MAVTFGCVLGILALIALIVVTTSYTFAKLVAKLSHFDSLIALQVYRKYCRTSAADLLNQEMAIANAVADAIDPDGSGARPAGPLMIKKGKGVSHALRIHI